jgi:hypothetical protein
VFVELGRGVKEARKSEYQKGLGDVLEGKSEGENP